MSRMLSRSVFSLHPDDLIRLERTGKLRIVGVWAGDVGVPQDERRMVVVWYDGRAAVTAVTFAALSAARSAYNAARTRRRRNLRAELKGDSRGTSKPPSRLLDGQPKWAL
jgi:hypothetical protein